MPPDFSHQNLRGRSFKGQDLAGANFSYADIRSCDFTGANLRKANFSHAKAGLQWNWVISLVSISLLISLLTGFSSVLAFSSFFVFINSARVLLRQLYTVLCIVIVLAMFAVFFFVIVRRGLEVAFKAFTLPMVVIGSGTIAIVGAMASVMDGIVPAAGAVGIAAAANGALVGLGSGSIAVAVVATMAGFLAETKTVSMALTGIVAVAGVSAGGLMAMAVGMAQLYAGTVPVVFLASYISWRTLIGDEKFTLIQTIAVAVAATGGTRFKDANLTDANFSGAILKSTDLTDAICTRTCWFQAKKLERARLKDTYLLKPMLRSVVITGEGINKNFDNLSLRGVNLSGASLVDASFIGADLSHANLQDANLTRAKLVQTQLDGTDFTGATLTGAYIEDWNITTDTKFDGVRCEYVYMRLPTPDNPDPYRKPDNRQEVFADGEFGDFIKPIFDTLDLYHNQGVDPRAIAISFKQLAENHPEADLRIVGMEVRGEDKFLLRAKTAIAADKSQLSAEYFAMYNQLKALAEQEVKALLAEKDNRITDLQNMVVTALQRPSFYSNVEQVGFMTNNPGGFSVGGSVGGDINNVQGENNQQRVNNKTSNFNLQNAQFGGGLVNADTLNADQIGGNITNYTSAQDSRQTQPDKSAVKTILILVSNPATTSPLHLDREVREIDSGLQRAKKRELFDLKQRWAVRVQDVYQSFLDLKPQIVHFSGHGAGEDGLVLEDEAGKVQLVDTQAIAGLFELFASSIECVVLNACYSEVQASAIALHIPYVIGMSQEIGDGAAIKFATGFYNALGAGETVEFAYKLGCSIIQLEGIPENLTPVLIKKQ